MLQMQRNRGSTATAEPDWPPQVELILSALETGQFSRDNRRSTTRMPYRVRGRLRLFSDPPNSAPWTIYTRDIHSRGLGFISPHRLPLGYGGMIDLPAPDGSALNINCTLLRCREAAPGWYEGSIYFNREQPSFAAEPASADQRPAGPQPSLKPNSR